MRNMILLFFLLNYSILWGQDISKSLYTVKKISLKGNYYNIEAIRNDSIFLIISKKTNKPEINGLKK